MNIENFIVLVISVIQSIDATDESYTYNEDFEKSYKVHTELKTWLKAWKICQREGGTLAMMESQQEVTFVLDLISRQVNRSFAIGFHNHFGKLEHVSVEGKSLQYYYNRWSQDFSSEVSTLCYTMDIDGLSHSYTCYEFTNGRCGSMDTNGFLHHIPCDEKAPFLCEKKDRSKMTNYRAADDDPEYKCEETTDKCYKLHWNGLTWPMARSMCMTEGGQLAIIRNSKVEQFLVEIFNKTDKRFFKGWEQVWLGMHDMFGEGTFITVEDKLLDQYDYVKWIPGEPNNDEGIEHCGAMRPDGRLNDLECTYQLMFFCERPKRHDFSKETSNNANTYIVLVLAFMCFICFLYFVVKKRLYIKNRISDIYQRCMQRMPRDSIRIIDGVTNLVPMDS